MYHGNKLQELCRGFSIVRHIFHFISIVRKPKLPPSRGAFCWRDLPPTLLNIVNKGILGILTLFIWLCPCVCMTVSGKQFLTKPNKTALSEYGATHSSVLWGMASISPLSWHTAPIRVRSFTECGWRPGAADGHASVVQHHLREEGEAEGGWMGGEKKAIL